jgi:hypothetical protein
MAEDIELSVGIETTNYQLKMLKSYMVRYIDRRMSREISNTVRIHSNRIYDKKRLHITVVLAHKGNHQNGETRYERRTRFMLNLIKGLEENKINLVDRVV